jgi:hypothetical protein
MVVQNFDVWVIVEEKAIAVVVQNVRSVIKESERRFAPTRDDDIHRNALALNKTIHFRYFDQFYRHSRPLAGN